MELPVLEQKNDLPGAATDAQPGVRERGRRLPPWLKRPLPSADFADTRRIIAKSGVATVCQEARCPNLTECWSQRAATFMILGADCTRRCHYCAVHTGRPAPPEVDEPQRLGIAAARLGLAHVVLTAVARDDLKDEGAGHFAECVRAVRRHMPHGTIEVLPADFHARRDCIETLVQARPDIYNHNLETVERLTPVVRPQAKYRRSLEHLRLVKVFRPDMLTKSGMMVGLGETWAELLASFADLRRAQCDVLTIGQYLQPNATTAPVAKFYTPEEFERLREEAERMGFIGVASGPFIRSSYNAAHVFEITRARRQAMESASFALQEEPSRLDGGRTADPMPADSRSS